jgi:hypothetical protein
MFQGSGVFIVIIFVIHLVFAEGTCKAVLPSILAVLPSILAVIHLLSGKN